MSAEEEQPQASASPAEHHGATPFQLYEDVDTTDSEGEGDHAHHHADHPAPEVTPELLATIVKQVEFYFSDANLPTDKKLLKQIKKDPSGQVPVKLFANFRKIRILTKDPNIIAMALMESQELVLCSDQRYVRRRVPVPDYNVEELQKRIVVVEHLPAGNTIETVSEIFSAFGHVKVVRICSRDSRGKLPGWMTAVCANSTSQQHAFVEYDREDDAVKAAAATWPEGDPHHCVKVGRLSVLLAALPPQLQPQKESQQAAAWRDDSQHGRTRSRGGAGSGRPSREPSPLGTRHSRLHNASGSTNKPLGRSSTEHPAKEGHRAPGSSGGADTAAVWGHEGFHPGEHKPLQRRMSQDRAPPHVPPHSWHHDAHGPHGHGHGHDGHGSSSSAAGPANGAKPGAYVAPGRRGDAHHGDHHHEGSAIPANVRSHAGSGACSPALTPASPRVARPNLDPAPAEHHHFSSYAAAAAAHANDSASHPGEAPASPAKPPASPAKLPAVGKLQTRPSGLSVGSSPAGTPRKNAPPRAAVDAVLADVMAAAAGAKAREEAGAAAARLPSPSASAADIGGLINKIITTPIVRWGSGDSSAFATPTVADAAAAAAAGLPVPSSMAVGDLINKILSDIPPAGASPTASSPSAADKAAGVPASRSPDAPAPAAAATAAAATAAPAQEPVSPWRKQPQPAPQQAAEREVTGAAAPDAATAAGGYGSDRGSASSMGRQLSVVPEGNEFERMMSAQLDSGLSEAIAAAHQAISIDRELSLGLKDDGVLALAAAAGSPQRAAARAAARKLPLGDAESSLTFAPPVGTSEASAPIAIGLKPPVAPRLAGAQDGEESNDGSSEAGDAAGEGADGSQPTRRRRTRRSRRRSSVMSANMAVGSPGVTAGAVGGDASDLPPTVAQQRDGPRQRRNSSGSAAASGSSRRVSDGASAVNATKDGSGSDAAKAKKHTKKDYAAWAAATPEYRAEATAKYVAGGVPGAAPGTVPPASPPRLRSSLSPRASPPRTRRPSEGHYGHEAHAGLHAMPSRGPDGSRGFAMGRGKPLAPPPPS